MKTFPDALDMDHHVASPMKPIQGAFKERCFYRLCVISLLQFHIKTVVSLVVANQSCYFTHYDLWFLSVILANKKFWVCTFLYKGLFYFKTLCMTFITAQEVKYAEILKHHWNFFLAQSFLRLSQMFLSEITPKVLLFLELSDAIIEKLALHSTPGAHCY